MSNLSSSSILYKIQQKICCMNIRGEYLWRCNFWSKYSEFVSREI